MRSRPGATEIESEAALYALGALPAKDADGFRQRVAAGCSLCTGLLEDCEQVVTLLPLTAPEVEPPTRLRARLLDSIVAEPRPALSEGILVRAGDTAWQDAPAPGIQYRPLHGSKTMLVRMAPKTWLPEHDHHLAEQCLVLEGSVKSDDVTAYAGDYVYMPAGSHHSALYSETGATFLIAYS
jgi:mannose-6-phosphate isomerase-like protein (cupin superfamily)